MKSIVIIIDYFGGKWPEWFPVFLESCRRNPTINWIFHTDCQCDFFDISNVSFHDMTIEDYKKHVNAKLGVRFKPANYYKLCDLRPMYGIMGYCMKMKSRRLIFGDMGIWMLFTAISEIFTLRKCLRIIL
jgi:hypothetical protein